MDFNAFFEVPRPICEFHGRGRGRGRDTLASPWAIFMTFLRDSGPGRAVLRMSPLLNCHIRQTKSPRIRRKYQPLTRRLLERAPKMVIQIEMLLSNIRCMRLWMNVEYKANDILQGYLVYSIFTYQTKTKAFKPAIEVARWAGVRRGTTWVGECKTSKLVRQRAEEIAMKEQKRIIHVSDKRLSCWKYGYLLYYIVSTHSWR
jgi:hypothetical protein